MHGRSLWIVALVALTALLAPVSANAENFEASSYPATVTGTSAKGVLKLGTEGGNVECLNHLHGEMKEPSSTLALTILSTECKAFGFAEAVVSVKECRYLLETTGEIATNERRIHVDLSCPEPQRIKIEAGTCTIEIPAQSNLETVITVNESFVAPAAVIELLPFVKNLTYWVLEDGSGCPLNGIGVKTNGTITSSAGIKLAGQNPVKPSEKIWVWVGTPEGPPSDGETGSPAFTGANYPIEVHGSSPLGNWALKTAGGSVECDIDYAGEITEAASKLRLESSFQECTAFGFLSATVSAEDCGYVLHATKQTGEDEFAAHFDLSCPEGQSVKIVAATCRVELRPQIERGSVSLMNQPLSSPNETVAFTQAVKGITYIVTQDGFGCPFSGIERRSDGELTSNNVTLDGFDPEPGAIDIELGKASEGKGPAFTAPEYPVRVEGTASKGSVQFLTEAGSVECDQQLGGDLTEAAVTLSLGMTFSNCQAFGFLSATVKDEGCRLVLDSTEELAPGKAKAHVDVSCQVLRSIKIEAATCGAEIKSQVGRESATVAGKASSPKTLAATLAVKAVAYTVTKDGFGCPFSGTGSKSNGELLSVSDIPLSARGPYSIGVMVGT